MSSALKEQEYEMQLWGFNQSSVVIGVMSAVKDAFQQIFESLSEKIKAKFKGVYDEQSIEQFIHLLSTSYDNSLESHSDELKNIVRECFSIRPNILLPEDEIEANNFDLEYEGALDKKIEAVKMKLIATKVMNEKLSDFVKKISDEERIAVEAAALNRSAVNLNDELRKISSYLEDGVVQTVNDRLALD